MNTSTSLIYRSYRFPRQIINHCVRLCCKFSLIFRSGSGNCHPTQEVCGKKY